MRDKEAIENERKNLLRNLEKQTKVVEKLLESEKSLNARIVSDLSACIVSIVLTHYSNCQIAFEMEELLWKKSVHSLKERINIVEAECAEWKVRAEGEHKRAEDVSLAFDSFPRTQTNIRHLQIRVAYIEYDKATDRKRSDLRKLEESLARSKREAEKQATKLKAAMPVSSGVAGSKESHLQVEYDKCMASKRTCTFREGNINQAP